MIDRRPVLRYATAYALLFLVLPSPLKAQTGEEVPRPESTAGAELLSAVEYQRFELDGGAEIEKLTIPITGRVTTGRLRISAQLPYVRVSGPGNVVAPSGPLGLPILVDPSRPAEVRNRAGLGDARLGVAYDLSIPTVNASLNAGAKLPTASVKKGLGTGQADYWIGADVSTTVGAVTPFAGFNFTKVGDPKNFELRDTISGQAGAALRLGGSASAHVGYSYSESADDVSQDDQRLFGGVNTALGKRVSLGIYGSAGVTGPANVGAGVSLGIGFK
jgi:hypothetical protein